MPPSLDLQALLGRFDLISLDAMQNVQLMDRLDTKFTFRADQLPSILHEMGSHYRLLDVNGVRTHRYETLYFDTDTLALYARHHSGKYTRHKIRYRRYADSQRCFFEIKTKSNRGRTLKRRVERECIQTVIDAEAEALLRSETSFAPEDFDPILWVNFTRLTFVSTDSPERLTLDVDLSYRRNEHELGFPKLVVGELKRDKSLSSSRFLSVMRELRIWEGSMSKYCFGVVNLYPSVKMNLFKERVKQIKQLAA
jgi:hypothetical protein